MSEKELAPHERRAVEKIRAMVASNFGKMDVVVHQGNINITGGPTENFKIGVDKSKASG